MRRREGNRNDHHTRAIALPPAHRLALTPMGWPQCHSRTGQLGIGKTFGVGRVLGMKIVMNGIIRKARCSLRNRGGMRPPTSRGQILNHGHGGPLRQSRRRWENAYRANGVLPARVLVKMMKNINSSCSMTSMMIS